MMNSVRFLGIDPGYGTTGLGLVESVNTRNLRAIEWLTISTASSQPFPERLKEIHDDLKTFIEEVKPDVAVIERVFFAKNETTALDVAHARGVILLCLQEARLPIVEVGPMQMKLAITGDGGADKRQVQDMLVRLLRLGEIPRPDDAADALAMAVYGALTYREDLVAQRREEKA